MKLDNKKWNSILFSRCLTSQGIAKECNIAESTIYRMTSGGECRPSTAKKICDFLGVNPEDIFEEE